MVLAPEDLTVALYEVDDPCHRTSMESIAHLTPVDGENRWECWCTQPCCNRPHVPTGLPVCICEFCSCSDPED